MKIKLFYVIYVNDIKHYNALMLEWVDKTDLKSVGQ